MNRPDPMSLRTANVISAIIIGWSCVVFPFPAASQNIGTNDPAAAEKRVEFLQQNFSRFVPVQFHKGADSEAVIQLLHVKENIFEYEGAYYCGFKFTVPEWLDGDFEWMYLLAKTAANKDFSTRTLNWFIFPETGRSEGFEFFHRGGFSRYSRLKAQFPYTRILMRQSLDKERLKRGKRFGIWFGFQERDMPDIAFAMTIDSQRGAKEFGALPLR